MISDRKKKNILSSGKRLLIRTVLNVQKNARTRLLSFEISGFSGIFRYSSRFFDVFRCFSGFELLGFLEIISRIFLGF